MSPASRTRGSSTGKRSATRQWALHQQKTLLLTLMILTMVAVAAIAAFLLGRGSGAPSSPQPIATVDTLDVHALAFLDDGDRVVLGHHGGILESIDGGKSWFPWGQGSDAMSLGPADDEPLVVAGHDVLAVARRDGQWQNIENDLPHIDIHGFARDPQNPNRMWAYLATGGLYESVDGGRHWEQVFAGHTNGLVAVVDGETTAIIAVDPSQAAIVKSEDGGRTWELVARPPSTPVYAMAAARSGRTILFSGSDGLFRSDDGGQTFSQLVNLGQPILALAATDDGETVIVATRDRSIFRSDDGGRTWPQP